MSPELLWNALHIQPNYNAWQEIAKWVLIAAELFKIVVNDSTARNLSVIAVSLGVCHFYKIPGMFFQKFVIIIQHVVKLQIIHMFQLYYIIPTSICYLPSKTDPEKSMRFPNPVIENEETSIPFGVITVGRVANTELEI